ncbi:MAG: hypothetical protein QW197_03525 [Candidatus Aenigmatarchaeota archaeon]
MVKTKVIVYDSRTGKEEIKEEDITIEYSTEITTETIETIDIKKLASDIESLKNDIEVIKKHIKNNYQKIKENKELGII